MHAGPELATWLATGHCSPASILDLESANVRTCTGRMFAGKAVGAILPLQFVRHSAVVAQHWMGWGSSPASPSGCPYSLTAICPGRSAPECRSLSAATPRTCPLAAVQGPRSCGELVRQGSALHWGPAVRVLGTGSGASYEWPCSSSAASLLRCREAEEGRL